MHKNGNVTVGGILRSLCKCLIVTLLINDLCDKSPTVILKCLFLRYHRCDKVKRFEKCNSLMIRRSAGHVQAGDNSGVRHAGMNKAAVGLVLEVVFSQICSHFVLSHFVSET